MPKLSWNLHLVQVANVSVQATSQSGRGSPLSIHVLGCCQHCTLCGVPGAAPTCVSLDGCGAYNTISKPARGAALVVGVASSKESRERCNRASQRPCPAREGGGAVSTPSLCYVSLCGTPSAKKNVKPNKRAVSTESTRIAIILNPPAGPLRRFDLLQTLPALSILV